MATFKLWRRGARIGLAFVTVLIAANITGHFFYAAAVFPQEAVTIEGETHDYKGRHFCPRCGASVFARSADEIEVHLGSLDAPDQLVPTYESWVIRREPWLPPLPNTRQYQRGRDAAGRHEEAEA